MKNTELIIEIARQNNGVITSTMVTANNISRGSLKYLVDKGLLEKVERGIYILPDCFEDEFLIIQSKYKMAIFSLETALFLHDLTDRTPIRFNMVFPYSYNLTNPKKDNILCTTQVDKFYSKGIESVKTPMGNIVRGYSIERTMCDILRKTNKVDIQVISDAYKKYVKLKTKNIPMLSEYSKLLKVENEVRTYLEVLL